jgi:ABC-2 type transport system permease protein
MKKTLIVAKWEFLEKVKTKAFIISLIITPLILILFSIAPAMLAGRTVESVKIIGVADLTDIYFERLKSKVEKIELSDGQPAYLLRNLSAEKYNYSNVRRYADSLVLNERIEGYIFIGGAIDSAYIEYRSSNTVYPEDFRKLELAFNEVRRELLISKFGITDGADIITRSVELIPIKINDTEEGKTGFLMVFISSIVFILLLTMMIIYSGQLLVRSMLEEKSNKLIDILISSCSPEELLTGKILGLSFLGLSQLFIWIMIAIGLVGASLLPFTIFNNFILMLVYFLLGFIFYTAIFVGIGSVVTTEQEAQQITTYLSMLLILPIILAVPAIENPDSILVKILSYVPLTLPSIMLLRLNIEDLILWEISLTICIMIVSIVLSISISAKIFRIGILSYGKRPTIKEIAEWLKEK